MLRGPQKVTFIGLLNETKTYETKPKFSLWAYIRVWLQMPLI